MRDPLRILRDRIHCEQRETWPKSCKVALKPRMTRSKLIRRAILANKSLLLRINQHDIDQLFSHLVITIPKQLLTPGLDHPVGGWVGMYSSESSM